MDYTKPQVADLGKAVRVIEQTGFKKTGLPDPVPTLERINPAYDLDE